METENRQADNQYDMIFMLGGLYGLPFAIITNVDQWNSLS